MQLVCFSPTSHAAVTSCSTVPVDTSPPGLGLERLCYCSCADPDTCQPSCRESQLPSAPTFGVRKLTLANVPAFCHFEECRPSLLVTYTCVPGFVLLVNGVIADSQNAQVTCGADGAWQNMPTSMQCVPAAGYVLAENGATCDGTCAPRGLACDSARARQLTSTTSSVFHELMATLLDGYTAAMCTTTATTALAANPSIVSGTTTSTCNINGVSHTCAQVPAATERRVCYCQCNSFPTCYMSCLQPVAPTGGSVAVTLGGQAHRCIAGDCFRNAQATFTCGSNQLVTFLNGTAHSSFVRTCLTSGEKNSLAARVCRGACASAYVGN